MLGWAAICHEQLGWMETSFADMHLDQRDL